MKRITREDYDKLEFNERAKLLWDKGDFVAHIEYYNRKICLYILEGFYVEVYYEVEENRIENIKTTSDKKRIALYLSKIDLVEILNGE